MEYTILKCLSINCHNTFLYLVPHRNSNSKNRPILKDSEMVYGHSQDWILWQYPLFHTKTPKCWKWDLRLLSGGAEKQRNMP